MLIHGWVNASGLSCFKDIVLGNTLNLTFLTKNRSLSP